MKLVGSKQARRPPANAPVLEGRQHRSTSSNRPPADVAHFRVLPAFILRQAFCTSKRSLTSFFQLQFSASADFAPSALASHCRCLAAASPRLALRYGLHHFRLIWQQPAIQPARLLRIGAPAHVQRHGRFAAYDRPWQEEEESTRRRRRAEPEAHLPLLQRARQIWIR